MVGERASVDGSRRQKGGKADLPWEPRSVAVHSGNEQTARAIDRWPSDPGGRSDKSTLPGQRVHSVNSGCGLRSFVVPQANVWMTGRLWFNGRAAL
jgi:hypothetical protein